MDLLSKAVPKNRRALGVSVVALVRRVPKMLGPVAGGACIALWGVERGVRAAFLCALALAAAAAVLQQVLIEDDSGPRQAAEPNPLRLWKEMPEGLRACCSRTS
jgi:MFS family permease